MIDTRIECVYGVCTLYTHTLHTHTYINTQTREDISPMWKYWQKFNMSQNWKRLDNGLKGSVKITDIGHIFLVIGKTNAEDKNNCHDSIDDTPTSATSQNLE